MDKWWRTTSGMALAQGDLLSDCLLPIFVEVDELAAAGDVVLPGALKRARLIIVTQSCDLENGKNEFVALCLVHSLSEFETDNPEFKKKWEMVRKGRIEGLHLLAGTEQPAANRTALVVDFRQIVSLPADYLANHAASLGERWRLDSPFLEHFSQAFARFFMRVGLPSSIPAYK